MAGDELGTVRISSNMSRWLLQAAPSAPSEIEMPLARISTIGARPDPSFRFEPGQCRIFTSCSAMTDCSWSSTLEQGLRARHREARRERRPQAAVGAANTESVSCAVSIVSTVVVPLISNSESACRAAAARDAGVCAASMGHTRVLDQSSSARSSA